MRKSKTHFDQVPVALVKEITKEIISAEIVEEEIATEITNKEKTKRKGIQSGHLVVPPPLARTQSNSAGISRHCRNGI
jgi:hypothetical protein